MSNPDRIDFTRPESKPRTNRHDPDGPGSIDRNFKDVCQAAAGQQLHDHQENPC